jgi:LPXTG-site transpeptidase (sortase) family protein
MDHAHGPIEPRNKPPVAVFLAATIVIFFLTLSAADSIDFVPDYIDGTTPVASTTVSIAQDTQIDTTISAPVALTNVSETDSTSTAELPTRLIIPSIDLDLAVQNPATQDVDALDALLVNGPARYSGSVKLGEVGTMIIFAHSSHLPIVHNKMFQAFNRIPELTAGDSVTVESGTKKYLYSVVDVTKADATDTRIDMSPSQGTRLVLVTCDTLTGKTARYVLEANLIGTYDL